MTKPSLPQGTRDFGPNVVRKRQFILNTIKGVFERYGFQPLETPAMENLETLMGKYGEEGDKLIFRILDSGNPFSKDFIEELRKLFEELQDYYRKNYEQLGNLKEHEILPATAENPFGNSIWNLNPHMLADLFNLFIDKNNEAYKSLLSLRSEISGKALKYDLTIPFARYVAMNYGKLTFPFKRYQMQPVWRADRPQRGRYREFYQCDADIVGSNALINEVEFVHIYHEALTQLGIKNYELRINSRKILTALAELCGGRDKMMDITIAIDKLDKIGLDGVKEELEQRGLNDTQVKTIEQYLNITGDNEAKLQAVKNLFSDSQTGQQGIHEINFILLSVNSQPSSVNLIIDFTLARGLNYYTGIIFEAKAPADVKIGSIGGGGRYDDLTGLFGVPDVPGVGISFGVDRIYDVMEELNLFPSTVAQGTRVLFFNMGENESKIAYQLLQSIRQRGIAAEIFHEPAKIDKQFKYAEKKNIPFVIIIGAKEAAEQMCTVKDLRSGEQKKLSHTALLAEPFN